jgi:hypothetical protein
MQSRSAMDRRFNASIGQVDELLAIYRYIHTNSGIAAKDHILRAALTMLVSSIDTSVHELVIRAIVSKLDDNRLAFNVDKQTISVQCVLHHDLAQRVIMAEADLRKQYTKETFRSSTQIETVLAEIGINKIWSRISPKFSKKPEDIKVRLDLMVRRRNQIVHEADLDSLQNVQRISIDMVEELYAFTKTFVNALFDEYQNLN